MVFDIIRRKYIVLTPEEFVRQLFIHFLIEEMNIAKKRIAVERQLNLNGKKFRFDILVFDKKAQPWLIVECKSYNVKLSKDTVYQIGKYNMQIKAPYLCITNGKNSEFYKIDSETQEIMPTKSISEAN